MTIKSIITLFVTSLLIMLAGCATSPIEITKTNDQTSISERLSDSLIHLNISTYAYEQMQPWKSPDTVQQFGYGCAVGPYQVLTTAWNVTDAALIKARRHGKNEYIPVKIEILDYQSNLCLLSLDPEAAGAPLVRLQFVENYKEGSDLTAYWLSANGQIENGRGILDRAEVTQSTVSYTKNLNYIVADTSQSVGRGRVYYLDDDATGIACWADTEADEAGLIPAVTINRFLAKANAPEYTGFGSAGFSAKKIIDPATRAYLEMGEDVKGGIYVTKVYALGTASDKLNQGDMILSIDGQEIDANGRYEHGTFGKLSFRYLINSRDVGDVITFSIWRDGRQETIESTVKDFSPDEMLVPYYEYDKKSEYIITAGFIFQKLTRSYLQVWGDNWPGKVPPHLYNYYRNFAFKPSDDRKDIVILNYVLPARINLGYQGLGRLVVKTVNGKEITGIKDMLEAFKLNLDSKFDVIDFEHDHPTVVIPRDKLELTNNQIAQNYGIMELTNVNP